MAKGKNTKKHTSPSAEVYTNASDIGANVAGAAADVATSVDPMTLKQVFDKGWGAVKAHPWQAAGTGLLGAANLGGLFDNNKLLGQGIGAALGAAAPAIFTGITKIPLNIGTLGRVNLAMGGGALGSLFDTLRAKQEEEQAMQMVDPNRNRPKPYVIY